MTREKISVDVVVIGAGMAGLTAAVKATGYDIDVLVLEKGHRPGGSMWLSHGYLQTEESMNRVEEKIPHGAIELQQMIVEEFNNSVRWLEDLDVNLKDFHLETSPLSSDGKLIEPQNFTQHMITLLENNDAEIRMECAMDSLRTRNDHEVCGVVAQEESNHLLVDASSVVLATGGFQGNEYLIQEFITDQPENVYLRSNPWSTGDGLLAALDVNAKMTMAMDSFYGHNMVAPPANFSPSEFADATQYYGAEGIAIDVSGSRFTDESESLFEHTLAQDTAKLANGRAFLIIDQDIYSSKTITEVHIGTIVERARDLGGPVAESRTLEGLADKLSEWGVNGSQALETVNRYNEAIQHGSATELRPPRRRKHNVIDECPYYAIEVRPGITFTMGGIDVTPTGEVLRRTGTSSTMNYPVEDIRDARFQKIPGLYASGADVGNIHNREYLGGLAVALVTGVVAGENAALYAGGN